MGQLATTETLLAYHEAVRSGASNVDELREKWKQELDVQLNQVVDRTSHNTQQAQRTEFKRGEKRKIYNELIQDYRLCMQLAKQISDVKKTMREE